MDPLLQRACAGDEAAWRDLIGAHQQALQRYLDRRMGARLRRGCSASDLMQEVCLRVFRALRSAPADATERTFRRWLYRHADWVLAERGHAARRHEGESVAGARGGDLPARERSTGDGEVTHRDQVAWLRALLDRLAPKYGDVVRLRLEGLSFAAIGARLGLQEATVRQRLSRVLRTLTELPPADG